MAGRNMQGVNNPSYKHGNATRGKRPKLYVQFMNMKARCNYPSNKDYIRYGAIGIRVCDRWMYGENGITGYECFVLDMGIQPEGTSIDRIDGAKWYSPDNCRWATVEEQANNRKSCHYLTIDGETKTISQWSKVSGIGKATIRNRLIEQNMNPKDAVYKPLTWTKKRD